MSTRIGVDHLVYAIMTTEETATTPPIYEIPKRALGLMTLTINPNASSATLFADDGPMDTASTLGNIDVEIEKNELKPSEKADFLGHPIDTNGAVIYNANDVAPYLAIGFRSLKTSGNYRYIWMYKGKFVDPEDNYETKGDTINFNTETITGQFVKLNYEITIGEKKVQPWKYEADGDDEKAAEVANLTWFTKVLLPGGAVTPGTLSAGVTVPTPPQGLSKSTE